MTHAIHSVTHPHPNPGRIAGMAAAIAMNAGLLLILLVPMEIPPIHLPTPPLGLQVVDVTPVKVVPVTSPIPKVDPNPVQTPVRPQVTQSRTPAPVLVENGNEAAPDIPPAPVASVAPAIEPVSAPVPGVRLEYLQAPAPDYPRAALRARTQGTVLLQVLVDVDGKPLRVDVQDSSGDRRLDAAAREQVLRHWRFRPAMRDGHAVQAIGLVPIAFNLAR